MPCNFYFTTIIVGGSEQKKKSSLPPKQCHHRRVFGLLCLPVHPITVWPTSPYCPITTSTHHTQSCQAGSTVTPLLIALVFSTPSNRPFHQCLTLPCIKQQLNTRIKTCPKALHSPPWQHYTFTRHERSLAPFPAQEKTSCWTTHEKLPAELHKNKRGRACALPWLLYPSLSDPDTASFPGSQRTILLC